MYLKRIVISNFRCFKRYSVEFAPGITVLFGKNGTGKTTIVHALHKALGFMMYSDKIYETVLVKGKKKRRIADIRTITNNNPYLRPEGFSKDDFNNHEDKVIEISAWSDFGATRLNTDAGFEEVEWSMSAFANNCKLRPSEFKSAFREFYQWHVATGKLPLLAYFSDSFPHREDTKKKKIVAKIRALRNFGYFDWDEDEGCMTEWIDRLETNLQQQVQILAKGLVNNDQGMPVKAELQKEDEKEFAQLHRESSAIETCLKRFTDSVVFQDKGAVKVENLSLGKINGNAGKLCLHTHDGREFPFRTLPAGYKRLFSMVLDVAYRSYILSECTTTDIPGIVIIDEIDLHLHPELEKVVLQQLRATFPQLQFIVSTHSPLVLTGMNTVGNTNRILRLETGQNEPDALFDVYGLDINSSMQLVMGVNPNDDELNRWIDRCAYMRSKGLIEQSENLKQFIVNKKLLLEPEIEERIGRVLAKLMV